jgi:hypothetical protein
MGDNLTGLYAAAACMAAFCLSGTAGAQAPPPLRDTGARGAIGAPGVVVRFEESASKGVVYHEETGSMVSTIPPPVKAAAKAPAVAEKAAPPKTPAATPTKVAERRAVPPDAGAAVKQ